MAKNESARARKLRKQREAAARRRGPVADGKPGTARFRCRTCGVEFAHPGMEIADIQLFGPDGAIPVNMAETIVQSVCPVCGQPADALNMASLSESGHQIVGFADTPEHVEALRKSLQNLALLREDATFDQIVSVLEEQGPEVRPIVEYLRRHHLELAALGVGLLALVIALLTWLEPRAAEQDPPPTPNGITYEQMERLVQQLEVEDSPPPAQTDPTVQK